MPNEHITAAQQALREKDFLTIEKSLNRITDYKNLTKEEYRLVFDLYLICASHAFYHGQVFKAHTLVQQAETCFFSSLLPEDKLTFYQQETEKFSYAGLGANLLQVIYATRLFELSTFDNGALFSQSKVLINLQALLDDVSLTKQASNHVIKEKLINCSHEMSDLLLSFNELTAQEAWHGLQLCHQLAGLYLSQQERILAIQLYSETFPYVKGRSNLERIDFFRKAGDVWLNSSPEDAIYFYSESLRCLEMELRSPPSSVQQLYGLKAQKQVLFLRLAETEVRYFQKVLSSQLGTLVKTKLTSLQRQFEEYKKQHNDEDHPFIAHSKLHSDYEAAILEFLEKLDIQIQGLLILDEPELIRTLYDQLVSLVQAYTTLLKTNLERCVLDDDIFVMLNNNALPQITRLYQFAAKHRCYSIVQAIRGTFITAHRDQPQREPLKTLHKAVKEIADKYAPALQHPATVELPVYLSALVRLHEKYFALCTQFAVNAQKSAEVLDTLVVSYFKSASLSDVSCLTPSNTRINASQTFAQGIHDLLRELSSTLLHRLIAAPGDSELISGGSLRLNAMTPESDVDLGLLAANQKETQDPFFVQLVESMQFLLIGIGTPLWFYDVKDNIYRCETGLHIDGDNYKKMTGCDGTFPEKKLLTTPQKLVTYVVKDYKHSNLKDPYDFLSAVLVYQSQANTNLLASFHRELSNELNKPVISANINTNTQPGKQTVYQDIALFYMDNHYRDYFGEVTKSTLNHSWTFKDRYLKPLQFWCLDLALFYGLMSQADNPGNSAEKKAVEGKEEEQQQLMSHWHTLSIPQLIQQLLEHHCINAEYAKELQSAYAILQLIREQLVGQSQNEIIKKYEALLSCIDVFVLKPAYSSIEHFKKNADSKPFDPAFMVFDEKLAAYNLAVLQKNDTPQLLQALQDATEVLTLLLINRKWPGRYYLNIYRQLPEQLQPWYLEIAEAQIIRAGLSSKLNAEQQRDIIFHLGLLHSFWLNQLTAVFSAASVNAPLLANPQGRLPVNGSCQLRIMEQGHTQRNYSLPQTWLEQIFNPDGSIKPTVPERNSAKFDLGEHYCLKIISPDDNSYKTQVETLKISLTREYAVSSFTRLLPFDVVPEGCAVMLTFRAHPQSPPIIYYAWLAERVKGHDLNEVMKTSPQNMANIDSFSYSLLFLLSLLILPEDGQYKNFMVQASLTANGKSRLWSVDNKRVFVNPIQIISSWVPFFSKDQQKLNLKTCLYFLTLFEQEFDADAIAACKIIEIKKLILQWLKAMDGFDQAVATCVPAMPPNARTNGQYQHISFDRLWNYAVPFKLEQMIRLMTTLPAGFKHIDFLKHCEPELYLLYQAIKQSKKTYYDQFNSNYRRNNLGQWFTQSTQGNIVANKARTFALAKSVLHLHPQLTATIIWKDFSVEQQHYFLQLLLQGRDYQELNLSHCVVIRNADLEALLKQSPNLTSLNVSACPHLSDSIFGLIKKHSKKIVMISCEENHWLRDLVWAAELGNLEVVLLNGCANLTKVDISKAPQLKDVRVFNTSAVVSVVNIVNFYIRGREQEKLKQYGAAIAYYDTIIRLNPNIALYYYNRANSKYALRQYAAAIADYNEAIRLNPNNALYYACRADPKHALQQYEAAIADYNEAIRLNPNDHNYYYNRANLKSELKQNEAAIADLTDAIRLNPSNDECYYNRAHSKHELKQYETAIADYNEAIRLNPNDHNYYHNRAISKDELKQYEAAIADYSEAIRLNPNDALYYHNRAISKYQLKQYEAAIADYNEAIRLNPNIALYYFNRAISKYQLKQYEAAIADYNEAIRLNPNIALYYFNRANSKYELKQYEAAITDYNEAIRLNPNIALYYFNRAISKYQLKQYEAAIADYNEATRLNPNIALYYNNRGDTKFKIKRYNDAIIDFDEAIQLNPNDALYYSNRANSRYKLNQYEAAIADYNEAIRLNPNDASYYNDRANSKCGIKQYEPAIADYSEAIRLNPNNAHYYNNRAVSKYELKQYEAAITDYNEAIRLNPNDANYYNNRANSKCGIKQYEPAIADYSEAIRLNPNNAHYYNNRAVSKYALQQYEAAIADYNKAIRLDPNIAHYYFNRANSKYELKQYAAAIDDYNEAIRLNPNDVRYYNNRAYSKFVLKQYEAAITDYNEAIRLNPNDDNYYYNRANSKYQLKQYEAAIADYNEAIHLNPNSALYYSNRAYSKFVLKQYEAAITDYNEAIRLNPNIALYYHNRAVSKYALQQYEAAIADYNEAIRLNPNSALYYSNRAVSKYELKQYEAEIADYNEAIRLNPNNALHYFHRASSKYELKQYEAAIADCNEAIRLGQSNAYILVIKGFALLFSHNLVAAHEQFNQVLALSDQGEETQNMENPSKIGLSFIEWLNGISKNIVAPFLQKFIDNLSDDSLKIQLTCELLARFYIHVIEQQWLPLDSQKIKNAYIEVVKVIQQVMTDCPKESAPFYYYAKLILFLGETAIAKKSLQHCLALTPQYTFARELLESCETIPQPILTGIDIKELGEFSLDNLLASLALPSSGIVPRVKAAAKTESTGHYLSSDAHKEVPSLPNEPAVEAPSIKFTNTKDTPLHLTKGTDLSTQCLADSTSLSLSSSLASSFKPENVECVVISRTPKDNQEASEELVLSNLTLSSKHEKKDAQSFGEDRVSLIGYKQNGLLAAPASSKNQLPPQSDDKIKSSGTTFLIEDDRPNP